MYLHESIRLHTQHDIYATANLYQFLNPNDRTIRSEPMAPPERNCGRNWNLIHERVASP